MLEIISAHDAKPAEYMNPDGLGVSGCRTGMKGNRNMTLPVATLDHVVINARDDMDRAADIYRRLGFTLTERGYHSLGSMNHLAMFGTDYLELIAVPKGATTGRLDLLTFPLGLNGLVFGSEDSAITYSELTKVGVPIEA